jgi:hypothetical protein
LYQAPYPPYQQPVRQRVPRWAFIAIAALGICAACSIAGVLAIIIVPTPSPSLPVRSFIAPPTSTPAAPLAQVVVPTTAIPPSGDTPLPDTPTQPPAPPTNTQPPAVPPTHTSLPAPTPGPAIASGGLGLTKAQWEALEGPPVMYSNTPWYGGGNHYNVTFTESGLLYVLLAQYHDGSPVDLAVAKAELARLIPQDSKVVRHFKQPDVGGDPMLLVTIYRSAALAKVLGSADVWGGAQPGTFDVEFQQYAKDNGGILGFTISTGDFVP